MSNWKNLGLAVAVFFVAVGIWARYDYNDWVALGDGGVPHTLDGWLMVTELRFVAQDPLNPKPFEGDIDAPSDIKALKPIAARSGERPEIAPHPIPHRQLTQHGHLSTLETQKTIFDNIVATSNQQLYLDTSGFERHNDAIWVIDRLDLGEIAHIHPSDGSIHAVLSPSDALEVLQKKRGELHPLAGMGGKLAASYTLLYSPRTEEEVEINALIVNAAVAYAMNRKMLNSTDPSHSKVH